MNRFQYLLLPATLLPGLSACSQPTLPPTLSMKVTPSHTLSRVLTLNGTFTGVGLERVEARIGTQIFSQKFTSSSQLETQTLVLPLNLARGLNTIELTGFGQGGLTSSQKLSVTLGSAVMGGSAHSAAILNERVYGWGRNNQGQVGGTNTSNVLKALPIALAQLPVSVSGGVNSTLLLGTDGNVYQLGQTRSTPASFVTAPIQIAGLDNVQLIASGQYHHLAVTGDGSLYAWGANNAGQLSAATTITYTLTPVKVPLSEVISVAGGGSFSVAATRDGQVYTWGDGAEGQLGRTEVQSSLPTLVPGLSDVVMVAAGKSHALALTRNGDVYSWGQNATAQLGRVTTLKQEATPQKVMGLKAVQIYASGNFSLALDENGQGYGWGQNGSGNLGVGSSDVPAPISIGMGLAQLSPGLLHVVALTTDGQIQTMGLNSFGQLGDGKTGLENNRNTLATIPVGN